MTPTGVLLVVGLALGSLATAPGAAVFNVDTTADDPALTSCDDATPNGAAARAECERAEATSIRYRIGINLGDVLGRAAEALGVKVKQRRRAAPTTVVATAEEPSAACPEMRADWVM